MAEKDLQITNHDFLIYRDSNNDVKVSVMLINNDIWLTQNYMANSKFNRRIIWCGKKYNN